MESEMNNLGKTVKANYATGGTFERGRIIAYCPQHSYIIERDDGTRFSWRCDLCEVLEDDRHVIDMIELEDEKDKIAYAEAVYNDNIPS